MSIPKKHHFLPEFFLKKWCDVADGRLVHFQKPYGPSLVASRKYPSQVCFERFLYSLVNLPIEEAQVVETEFFSEVDSKAALALEHLTSNTTVDTDLEEHWWRFIATLMARMPSDVKKFREINELISNVFLPILEGVAALPEFVDGIDEIHDASIAVKQEIQDTTPLALSKLMGKEALLKKLRVLHWQVISTEIATHELLLSDRPVQISFGGSDYGFNILLPIGPNKLFVAVENNNAMTHLKSISKSKVVKEVNSFIVGSAEEHVIGRSDVQKQYIEKYMGKTPSPSWIDLLTQEVKKIIPEYSEAMSAAMKEELKNQN